MVSDPLNLSQGPLSGQNFHFYTEISHSEEEIVMKCTGHTFNLDTNPQPKCHNNISKTVSMLISLVKHNNIHPLSPAIPITAEELSSVRALQLSACKVNQLPSSHAEKIQHEAI